MTIPVVSGVAAYDHHVRLRLTVVQRDRLLSIYVPAGRHNCFKRLLSKSRRYAVWRVLGHLVDEPSCEQFHRIIRCENTGADHFMVLPDAQAPDEIIGLPGRRSRDIQSLRNAD